MATIKSFTSIEQSRKLAEILPFESADIILTLEGNSELTSYPIMRNYSEFYNYLRIFELEEKYIKRTYIPAWSLAALMKLLPSEFTTENKFGKYKYEINIRKYKLADNVDIYQIAYGNYKWYEDGSHSWKDMINTGEKEDLLDAAYEMVVWLKENGKL